MKFFEKALTFGILIFFIACNRLPETPEETLKELKEASIAKEPFRLYQLLPVSFQADIQEIVFLNAKSIDREAYNRMVKSVQFIASGVSKHKEKLSKKFEHRLPYLGGEKGIFHLNRIFLILQKNFGSYEKLNSINVKSILKSDGKKFLEALEEISKSLGKPNPVKEVTEIEYKLISKSKGNAQVELFRNGKIEKINLVKIQNRWIPEKMVNSWNESIQKTKKKLQNQIQNLNKKKSQYRKFTQSLLEASKNFEKTGDLQELVSLLPR